MALPSPLEIWRILPPLPPFTSARAHRRPYHLLVPPLPTPHSSSSRTSALIASTYVPIRPSPPYSARGKSFFATLSYPTGPYPSPTSCLNHKKPLLKNLAPFCPMDRGRTPTASRWIGPTLFFSPKLILLQKRRRNPLPPSSPSRLRPLELLPSPTFTAQHAKQCPRLAPTPTRHPPRSIHPRLVEPQTKSPSRCPRPLRYLPPPSPAG